MKWETKITKSEFASFPSVDSDALADADRAYAAGDFGAARGVLERALDSAPGDVQVLRALGAVCFRLDDFAAAQRCFRTATEIEPKDVELLVQLALANQRLGLVGEAEAALHKALVLDPKNRDALKASADLQFHQGRFIDASKLYSKILQQKFDDIETLLALGVCFFKADNYKSAEVVFRRILKIDPAKEVARENLEAVRRAARE